MGPFYLFLILGLTVDWIHNQSYEMVKYRKCVQNWCIDVFYHTTPVLGAKNMFLPEPYCGIWTEWVKEMLYPNTNKQTNRQTNTNSALKG